MPHLDHEHRSGYPINWVAGADEVGRGCIAGPVVAAAVVIPAKIDFKKDSWLTEVNDSKKLIATVRERLVPLINSWAVATSIGIATVEEVDQLNIFHASHLAMCRAIDSLSIPPQHVLIDGKFIPKTGLNIPASAVIKGDSQCLSIAAASILAKVWRDQLMVELDQEFPGYGLAQHKGYPTPAHTQALIKQGVSKIHRRSFKTVSALL
jgi:ribonuclease HII